MFNTHRFELNSNSTSATLDNTFVDLATSWELSFGNTKLTNIANGNKQEISIENDDISITFIRKVYMVQGLEPQWHYDYKAKLYKDDANLHG